MAASPSNSEINAAKRKMLNRIAKDRGGRVEGGECILPSGVKVGYRLLRASNGECALMPYADCEGYVESFFSSLDALIAAAEVKYLSALAKAAA